MLVQNIYQRITSNKSNKLPSFKIDSRKIESGDIFIALKGINSDGNDYIEKAIENCASLVIGTRDFTHQNYIKVDDSERCLVELAKIHRQRIKAKVIGLTGSNAKTTSKELIAGVLEEKYKVTSTKGNLNNHLGVPLTILDIPFDSEFSICEMGANHLGEIEYLCEIAKPDFGIITNIGRAHIGEFGSYENIVKTKLEIFNYLKENHCIAFVNGDDDLLVSKSFDLKHIFYSMKNDDSAFLEYKLSIDDKGNLASISVDNIDIKSNLFGAYNSVNIALAVCIGKYFGVDLENIKLAIESYKPIEGRSNIKHSNKDNKILFDAYNANPTSVKLAINDFMKTDSDKPKTIILGGMKELGDYSLEEHENIVKLIPEDVESYYVGKEFEEIVSCDKYFETTEELLDILEAKDYRNRFFLLKGSRSYEFEKILKII